MTAVRTRAQTAPGLRRHRMGSVIGAWLSSTDHKVIGKLYLATSFVFFLGAGAMAMLTRAELAGPGMQVLGDQKGEQLCNQLVTTHSATCRLWRTWGWGRSLEWAPSCPPPRHNFTSIPRIRSESPAFDLHHPEVGGMLALTRGGTDGS